jgi:hypothetical protein
MPCQPLDEGRPDPGSLRAPGCVVVTTPTHTNSAFGSFLLTHGLHAWAVAGDLLWPGSCCWRYGYAVSAGIAQLARLAGLSPTPGGTP